MGKKGLIGEKPRNMHQICSAARDIKKIKEQRDKIKLRALEHKIDRIKPARLEQTIKELEMKERAGKLDHNDEIKLRANQSVLKKKKEKEEIAKKNKSLGEAVEKKIAAGKDGDAESNSAQDAEAPGFEPNSSIHLTGKPTAPKGNFVSEAVIGKTAVMYDGKSERSKCQSSCKAHGTGNIFEKSKGQNSKGNPLDDFFQNNQKIPDDEGEGADEEAVTINPLSEESKTEMPQVQKRLAFIPPAVLAKMQKVKPQVVQNVPPVMQDKSPEKPMPVKKSEIVIQPKPVVSQPPASSFLNVSSVPRPDSILFDNDDDE